MKKCSRCNIKLEKDKNRENRTICKNCYNKKESKCNKISEKEGLSRLNKRFNKSRTLIDRTFFFGDTTHQMLNFFSRIPDQVFYKITKSPAVQYFYSKIKIKESVAEIRLLNE